MRLVVRLKCRDCGTPGEGELEVEVISFVASSFLSSTEPGLMFKKLHLPEDWRGLWPPGQVQCADCAKKAGHKL